MSSETITSADHKMGRAVEAMERDFQAFRTGRASTALVERLTVDYYGTQTPLNQLAGISVPEAHQIVIQPWDRARPRSDREGDPEERHRARPERRRHGRPAEHPAADRGASQGPREERPQADGGCPGRGPEPPSRGRGRPQEGGARRRRRDRRVPSPARPAPEDDRSMDRRGRPPRRRQGTGGHGGLVAGPPLARPTDAPPTAHRAECRGRRRPRRDPGAGARSAPARGRPPAPRRDHHGRQSTLGPPARPAGGRGPCRRRRGDPDPPPPRGPSRRPGRDGLRLQSRELGPLGRRGPQPLRPPRAGDPQRDRRAEVAGRPDPASGPAGRAAGRHPPLDRRRARGDCRRHTPPAQRRVQLRRSDGAGRRVPADRRQRRRSGRRSTRRRSRTRCTRPASRIRIS